MSKTEAGAGQRAQLQMRRQTHSRALGGWLMAAACGLTAALGGCGNGESAATAQAAAQGPTLTLSVLSSRPEHVSGGTALVALQTSGFERPTLALNGVDVSPSLVSDGTTSGRYAALLSGVRDGENALSARSGSSSSTITITGYPISGPIVSGPQQTPFICQTGSFKLPDGSTLGAASDANCTVPSRVDYAYLPIGAADLVALPVTAGQPIKLPADIATATTLKGVTMPFVVRLETRMVDRGVHQSAVLFDPTRETEPTPWMPPKAWNRRLLAINGVGCAPGWYLQGSAQGSMTTGSFDFRLLSAQRLGEGYALYANTLQHGANNCNPLLASEASMMSKETFVKTYGVPAFTLSSGCSGGSYGALQPADMIPGLYDGVLVACVFTDGLSSSINGTDARLLARYFTITNPTSFTLAQRLAVTGYKSDTAMMAAALQSNRTDPVPNRVDITGYVSALWSSAVPVGLRYDAVGNPKGARPTVYDTAKNVLGVDTATGFARRPYDNAGLQYGLAALNAGQITPAQFLDLNEKIGGVDADATPIAARSVGDSEALTLAYRSGLILHGGGGLANIPVFDATGVYSENDNYHQQWQHFALRDRLAKANGDTGNFVMWRGSPVPGDVAWNTFVAWVVAYKADSGSGTQRDKVIRNRPAAAADGCWSGSTFVAETLALTHAGTSTCSALMPSWTFPREVAGSPVAANILKCQLKPVVASDYAVPLSDTELQRLRAIFPGGVCDWSQSGVGQTALVAHASFGPSPSNLVFNLSKQLAAATSP